MDTGTMKQGRARDGGKREVMCSWIEDEVVQGYI